ncbi:hypothetical protein [Plantactinospora veratri]
MSRRSTAPRLPDGPQVVLRETGADLTGTRVQRPGQGRRARPAAEPARHDLLVRIRLATVPPR